MTNTPKPSSSSTRASLTAKLVAAKTDRERLVILGLIRRLSQLTGDENARNFLAELLRNANRNGLSASVLPRFLDAFEEMGGDRRELVKAMRQDPHVAALLRKQFNAPFRALPPRAGTTPFQSARRPQTSPRQRRTSANRIIAIARRLSGERAACSPDAALSDSSNSPPHPPPAGDTPRKTGSARRTSLGKRLSDLAMRMSPIKKRRSLDLQPLRGASLSLYAPQDTADVCAPVLRRFIRFEEE